MASRTNECKGEFAEWRKQVADASMPAQLTAEHTDEAVRLPGFEPVARCILARGEAVGIDAGGLLDRVEVEGAKARANDAWRRAVGEVEYLRTNLQRNFLGGRSPPAEPPPPSLLRRALGKGAAQRASPAPEVALAPSAGDMGIDELRVCQVWMYAMASRLGNCNRSASAFAESAGMADPNSPLRDYDEARWDPRASVWQEMEACVHLQAAHAGTRADAAWRRPLATSTAPHIAGGTTVR